MIERWITKARLPGEDHASALRIVDGRITGRADEAPQGAEALDAGGRWLVPMLLDTHVHLAFAAGPVPLAQVADKLLSTGIAAVLDLGAPLERLPGLHALAPLSVACAGPLLCAPRGYPTQSWGQGGYGLPLATPDEAIAAVRTLAAAGVKLLKLSLDGRSPRLGLEVATAIVTEGRQHGLQSAAHALDVEGVTLALEAGVDVLAHTPVELLPDALIAEAGRRTIAVLSTLHAFGGTEALLENLARLHAAGARVLFGTDLGNEHTAPGLIEPELRLLARAGLAPAQILAAATHEAARLTGFSALGGLHDGAHAHLLALDHDPLTDASVLARPAFLVLAGERRETVRPQPQPVLGSPRV